MLSIPVRPAVLWLVPRMDTNSEISTIIGTQHCQPIPVTIGGTTILMIDTPGFDDPKRPDSEILREIAFVLVAQHKLGVELKGIIYIHRITEARFKGSGMRTLSMLRKICGDGSMGNVLLTSSGWSERDPDHDACSRRERQLRDGFWSCMVACGSPICRFYGDQRSAIMLICQLLMKKPVVLEMQKELVDQKMELKDTAAGAYLYKELEALERIHEEALRDLTANQQTAPPRVENTYFSRGGGLDMAKEHQEGIQRARTQQGILDASGRIDQKVDEEVKRQSRGKTVLKFLSSMAPFIAVVLQVLFGVLNYAC